MPKRGENIYKRKDARWEGRYIKSLDPTGKARYGYVYARTYREVREKLNACKHKPPPARDKRTFGTFCEEWLVLSRDRVKESSYVKYHTIVEKHILPRLGTLLPQELNVLVVEDLSHSLLSAGLSVKTVRDILTVLRSILRYCRCQLGPALPEIQIVYPRERKKEMRVLSMEEQTRLMSYLLADLDPAKFGVLLALRSR